MNFNLTMIVNIIQNLENYAMNRLKDINFFIFFIYIFNHFKKQFSRHYFDIT